MKKILLALSAVFTIAFIGCGGGSSSEAKELLQRILKVVGINNDMVVTICQDTNNDRLCQGEKIQKKIRVSKEDSLDNIWKKVTELSTDTYFMENYNPSYPILLILDDDQRVTYNGKGEFGLSFDSSTDGFGLDHNNTPIPRKELSVLQSMIDAKQLTKQDVLAVRGVMDQDGVVTGAMKDVDQFYNILLEDLATNVNTLGKKGLTPKQVSDGNIKEMAEELLTNGVKDTLPAKMNACNGEQTCINNVLNPLHKELLITDAEAEKIAREQKGTEEESNSNNSGVTKRDMILVKETEYLGTGEVEETTTYQYNSNNIIISDKSTRSSEYFQQEEICTYIYTNQNRLSATDCVKKTTYQGRDTQEEKNKIEYFYTKEQLSRIDSYINGNLDSRQSVMEWDGDTPKKIENKTYTATGEEVTENGSTWTIDYTGKNPTRIDIDNQNATSTIIKQYDNKLIPEDIESSFGVGAYWYYGINNVVREEKTSAAYSYKEVTDNVIKYNSSNLPTRIDKTTTTTATYGNEPYTSVEKSYTIYEYKSIN